MKTSRHSRTLLSICIATTLAAGLAAPVMAQDTTQVLTAPVHRIDKKGQRENIGEVRITPILEGGVMFSARLKNIPVGDHGFHVHERGDCGPGDKNGKVIAGGAAGAHYDPQGSGKHGDTKSHGHLGDLPSLRADAEGNVNQSVVAQRLTLEELRGRAVMIHGGGDNHKDVLKPDGGGGGRIACGVIG